MYYPRMAGQLREPSYFLLAALLDGPLHGYAIAQTATDLSEGRVRLTAGTLYGALDRLVTEQLVEQRGDEIVDGRRRRYYALTDGGRARLLEEAERLRSAAAVVETRALVAPRARGAQA